MLLHSYELDDDITLGSDFSICEKCFENLVNEKHVTNDTARKMLHGKCFGKKMFHVRGKEICEDCIKKAYDKMFNKAE